ncbi:MAG: hypothetical protein B6245_24155 [Desulfobacteraceae bacterium 4572_88]|nr:MAG: hypothetical protein B6245_24155 [Desulfobacteraceae bacterium 4572_88]
MNTKILVIDDEAVNVRVLSMSLKADGYDVVSAYSGKEGLEVFKKESPAIVLTDIKMPEMDGLVKRLERELLKSERLAAIGQTVAGMAHCIKNILHGFKGGSYLVDIGLDRNDTNRLKTGWQMIQRNIGRTSDLVLDLLSYSKERPPEYEPCLPNDVADDVCELLKENANEHDIEIIRAFSPDVGEVSMDPRTVYRCLLNLVSNAIDACMFDEDALDKEHCVCVRTIREEQKFIRFEVEDNGAGMSDEVRAKIFTSFFSTKGGQGTGLGLLVTMKLVDEHGGTIGVTSSLGKGTTFTIRFPYD